VNAFISVAARPINISIKSIRFFITNNREFNPQKWNERIIIGIPWCHRISTSLLVHLDSSGPSETRFLWSSDTRGRFAYWFNSTGDPHRAWSTGPCGHGRKNPPTIYIHIARDRIGSKRESGSEAARNLRAISEPPREISRGRGAERRRR